MDDYAPDNGRPIYPDDAFAELGCSRKCAGAIRDVSASRERPESGGHDGHAEVSAPPAQRPY
jgi:hypothetical protein